MLAIVAYHEPVSRAEIESIRGVQTAKGTLDVLLEAGWVRVAGRREVPGRPVIYATTPAFLAHFGLELRRDLPGIDELRAAGLLDPVDDAARSGDGAEGRRIGAGGQRVTGNPGENRLDRVRNASGAYRACRIYRSSIMGLSLPHLIVLALVVLLLFGRGKISELMGDFGKGIKSFKAGIADETSDRAAPPPPAQIAQPAPPGDDASASRGRTGPGRPALSFREVARHV